MKIAVLFLALIMAGCAAKTAVHPGATPTDSYAFDFLLVENAAIVEAKNAYLAGNLPASAHDPLNVAINQYDATNQIWQAYHAAGGTGDATALNDALAALQAAVNVLQSVLGKPAIKTPTRPVTCNWRSHGYAYS